MRKTLAMVLLSTSLLTGCGRPKEAGDAGRRARVRSEVRSTGSASSADGTMAITTPSAPSPIASPSGGRLQAAAGMGSGASRAEFGGSEAYAHHTANPWTQAAKDHLSTFAADVDTASYAIARRKLTEGTLPTADSVRVEEFVNYFSYRFPEPTAGTPFAVVMEAAPSPFDPARHLLRVGVATKAIPIEARQPAHLVFLVDTSGSMQSEDKLGLAKQSLRVLVKHLRQGDTVALVTYAGDTRVVLAPTGLDEQSKILAAIEDLTAGGSTAMGSGLDLAYQQAMASLAPGSFSRVIVLSDGDANVGAHTHEEMLAMIQGRAKEGVALSTIGFGMGNYKDELMEQLADQGNGNNFYIDSIAEANKVFAAQIGSTLEVVAKDAKLQVDFEPALVSQYRLVGYENRDVADQDFRNDQVDAGEIGAGHQVTALYELELTAAGKQSHAPLATVRIRHKAPTSATATESAFPMVGGPAASFAEASADTRFAFATAAFADVLRGGTDAEHWSLADIRDLAASAAGTSDERREFVELIRTAIVISGRSATR